MASSQIKFPGTGTDIDWRSINAIRFLAIDAVQKANSGHPGAPMGCAPMAYALWHEVLKHNPANPSWPDRDRFILSNGHASMLLYALLHLTGYDLSLDEIKGFRQWGSRTPGHPEHGVVPGADATTGPLGQGFANGVGMAIAERILADTYNRPEHEIIDHTTYAICSDGDLEEGVASEAASLAGTLELGKLIYFYDDNEISIEGDTDVAFREDVPARFRAYGWNVLGPVDGNDLPGLRRAIRKAKADNSKPTLVIVQTVIGFGSPNKAGSADSHGAALGTDEVELTRKSLGWDLPAFEVPEEVYGHMRVALEKGAKAEQDWSSRLAEYEKAHPELAARLKADLAGDLPDGWDSGLESLVDSFKDPVATRAGSGKAIEALAKKLPRLVGGSADLAGSNNTTVPGRGSFLPESPAGRTFHFGVREHAMGAVCNGIALHGGLLPYGGTFLIFSDYMRAAVRVGALSKLHTVWVYTHDSIGLGEDGPTHQPISQLMALRLIPNLTVIRPADANETLEAWRIAVSTYRGPVALALTRQNVPALGTLGASAPARGNVQMGGYVVRDGGASDLILISTGSEVQVALKAADQLERDGIAARVVSMPSWELFDAQSQSYRDAVLPPSVRARVSVEAGISTGWEHYVGLDGAMVGMTGYGASAPGGVAMEKLGFSAANVAEVARKVIARTRK